MDIEDLKKELDGRIFWWDFSKFWIKLQHKARIWQEWVRNRIEEKLK